MFGTICKDGGSLSVCKILINNQDFYCVAHDNSYIGNQYFANGLLSVNHTQIGNTIGIPFLTLRVAIEFRMDFLFVYSSLA